MVYRAMSYDKQQSNRFQWSSKNAAIDTVVTTHHTNIATNKWQREKKKWFTAISPQRHTKRIVIVKICIWFAFPPFVVTSPFMSTAYIDYYTARVDAIHPLLYRLIPECVLFPIIIFIGQFHWPISNDAGGLWINRNSCNTLNAIPFLCLNFITSHIGFDDFGQCVDFFRHEYGTHGFLLCDMNVMWSRDWPKKVMF